MRTTMEDPMTYPRLRAAERLEGFSPFWPVLVFFLAWLAWAVFQGYQLNAEAHNLQTLKGGQQAQVEQAQKVRQTLDALAMETQKLADAGNANARLVIEELRKRGITVNRPASEAPASK
jgi:hypothetical protein